MNKSVLKIGVIAAAVTAAVVFALFLRALNQWPSGVSERGVFSPRPERAKEITPGEFAAEGISQKADRPRGEEPESRLPLRLVGISEEGSEKRAFIEDIALSKTLECKIGDRLRGCVLIRILPDSVVLLRGRERVVLTLASWHRWQAPDDWIDTIYENNFVVSRERLGRMVTDINQLLHEAVPVPHIVGGKVDGFLIRGLNDDGYIKEAGLEEGDIIRSVNGVKIDSVKKPFSIYASLRELLRAEEQPVVTVEVLKNGKTHHYNYHFVGE